MFDWLKGLTKPKNRSNDMENKPEKGLSKFVENQRKNEQPLRNRHTPE
jgi:hypothetical protein